ncbi:MAG: hypothetical protein M3Q44_05910 [bacterium]|nr:hypothetical protein [bacterium]
MKNEAVQTQSQDLIAKISGTAVYRRQKASHPFVDEIASQLAAGYNGVLVYNAEPGVSKSALAGHVARHLGGQEGLPDLQIRTTSTGHIIGVGRELGYVQSPHFDYWATPNRKEKVPTSVLKR